jgi:hypothetical protein
VASCLDDVLGVVVRVLVPEVVLGCEQLGVLRGSSVQQIDMLAEVRGDSELNKTLHPSWHWQ